EIGHYIRDCMSKKKIEEMELNYTALAKNRNNHNRSVKERFPVERRGP
ncbi:16984_t:CDS:1, partial [Gigaspora rosea]